jgi:hypothetical protein
MRILTSLGIPNSKMPRLVRIRIVHLSTESHIARFVYQVH